MSYLQNLLLFVLCCKCLLIYAADSVESGATLAGIPTCYEKDENINDCMLKIFSEMIPRSKNGIPELNIPPMDPFVVNKTSFIFSHPLVQGKVSVRNVKIHGLSKGSAKSLNFKVDGNLGTLKVHGYVPKMFVEGMYRTKIKINNANITSKGPFNATFTDINVDVDGTGEFYEKDGHRYMEVKSFNFDPTVGNLKFGAENLLPEPLLNDAIVDFLNQNWRPIYKTLIPETRAAWEPEFVKLGNAFYKNIPIESLLKGD